MRARVLEHVNSIDEERESDDLISQQPTYRNGQPFTQTNRWSLEEPKNAAPASFERRRFLLDLSNDETTCLNY